MTSEEFESASSNSLGQGSSSTRSSSDGSKNKTRRESGHDVSTERRRRTRATASTFRNDGTPRRRVRETIKPVFRTQSIDPEVDRAIVADAVDFVVSASSKGCVFLVSSFAEHLKYKISLEEKVINLSKELQRLKLQPRNSVPILPTVSKTARLTEPSAKEKKVEKPDTNCQLLLPGVVPHSFNTSNERNYLKQPPTITISDLKDKGFSTENVTGSLPQISHKNESLSVQKSCVDSETQTIGESPRKPVMIERGCSPIPLFTSPNISHEDQINSVLLEQQFHSKLQERVKNCRDVETQTHFEIILRKPKLVERGCSPDNNDIALETVQQQPKKSKKIYSPTSNKKHIKHKSSGDLRHLAVVTKSRPSSAISVTNHSAKSFPGVKYRHDKCPCSTCIQIKKRPVKMKKET